MSSVSVARHSSRCKGALGYEITQTLFIGKNSLLVEGPSDILYLKAYSAELARLKRVSLDQAWTLTPVGSVDKVSAFMSLLYGNRLNAAVVTDSRRDKKGRSTICANRSC